MIKSFFEHIQAQFEPIKSFYLKDELNPNIWENDKMSKDIRKELIKITNDYLDYLDTDGIEIDDIILTGSLANFNWSKYSDFDVHLIFDFSKINSDVNLVSKFLDAKEKVWKLQHDILIKGFEVELYCQDSNQDHISSGQYSLKNSEWIVKPTKKDFKVDEELIKKKAGKIMDSTKDIEKELSFDDCDYNEVTKTIKKLWKKIKDGRQSGLEKDGEYSVENLVFKLLRRNGYIERIIKAKTMAYDKQFK